MTRFLSFTHEHVRSFRDVLVHPTQEMRDPDGAAFRGGPAWPRFATQILARHCRGLIPRPIDSRPLSAWPEWPYFDPGFLAMFWPQLGLAANLPAQALGAEIARLADAHAPLPAQVTDRLVAGIWCGPVHLHFGEAIAAWGMRIAGSGRIGGGLPLLFSLPPLRHVEPPPFFWDMLDHLQVDRRRVLLIRAPTHVERLRVIPQAERLYGGGPHPRHLLLMDEITADPSIERDIAHLFVSRAGMPDGHFAGESYLEEALAAAGAFVFRPETADLHAQLRLYRQARVLVFSEGSALHALQLLGHLGADLVVLVRRPGVRMAANSLRPRTRSLRYIEPRGLVHGVSRSGHPMRRGGITVLDETRLTSGLEAAGIDIRAHWNTKAYGERRDADIAAWLDGREGPERHPDDLVSVERGLRRLALSR
jgi:glycosyl transferase family 61